VNRPENSDSEFSWNNFADKNNNELLANLGNLVHRVLQFIYREEEKTIPGITVAVLSEFDIDFLTEMENRYIKYV
jgi:methionyl-tRNA synthetase